MTRGLGRDWAAGIVLAAAFLLAGGARAGVSPIEPAASDRRAEPESVWPPAYWFDPLGAEPAAVRARHAMVSTANAEASQAALDVLREGGTAIDAALAAQLVLNVVEPQSSGIGGGAFLLYLPPSSQTPVVIDGRESAPSGVKETLFLDSNGEALPYYPDRVTGGFTVGVPGTLAALALAHERYGRLPWPRLFEPAIALAEHGFTVTRRLHESIREEEKRLRQLPSAAATLFHPDGSLFAVGERFVQSDLARSLRLIASEGARVFYEGEIASDVETAVRTCTTRPGSLSRRDLAGYRAVVREPVHGRYRGYDVYGVGPPSSGGVAIIEALAILDHFELRRLAPGSAEALHPVLEATRLALADRDAVVGDPAFVRVPLERLTSPEFAASRARRIDPKRAAAYPVSPAKDLVRESQETSHLSIVDPEGGWLSMTTSIEYVFGSGILVEGRGFFLNNQLSDFDPAPRTAEGLRLPNRAERGKRPRSSMSPTIVTKDGRPFLAVGSPGGTRIIGVTLAVILNVVDWSMDIQRAIDFPRAYQRGRPGAEFESLFFDDEALHALCGVSGTIDDLAGRGHVIEPPTKRARGVGGVHAVMWRDSVLWGGADPRREGVALGF